MADAEYFGIQPTNVRDVEGRYRYIAIAGQTVFPANYAIGYVDVYYGGSHLDDAEFTATNGTSITLTSPATAGVSVVIVSRRQIQISENKETLMSTPTFVATAGQTSFPLSYLSSSVYNVTRNGIGVPFDASSGAAIILSSPANEGDEVKVFVQQSFSVANALAKTGDAASGPINLNGGATVTPAPVGDNSANVANTAWVNTNAVMKDSSTGAATVPSGTVAQRPATAGPGKIRFNVDYGRYEGGNGSNWISLGAATGGGSNDIFYENSQTITNDYTITTGKNAMTAGPITINNGISVTVPNGSTWTIV